jgi:hypothetical protein
MTLPVFVRLPHNLNTISVSFDGITYSHNEQSIFAYKLEGLDTAWQYTTNDRSISFANLAPGKYDFRVKVRKPNTGWSNEATFTFVIRTPFWKTWWFEALLILIAAVVVGIFVRMRIKRIQTKANIQHQLQELELKALKAANALMSARQNLADAEMQALRAQMNPHFIYNALNSIQSLVLDGRQQEAIRYISKFAKLLRQVLEHSENNLITLEKELNTLELYIQLEALRLNTELNYSIEVDENLLPEKELIPPLIIQPYVENALWHGLSHKQGERNLRVAIKATDDWLFVSIRDNGIGRQQAGLHKKQGHHADAVSKGMNITAGRLSAINGETGNEAVSVLDLYDDKQSPVGTEVTLRIVRTTKA